MTQVPRDARLISLILASKGIQDTDERVLQQLLDFCHRYTADVLQSAQILADHAARPGPSKVEKEDVELAIQMRKRTEFIDPPPRDYLATQAHELNVIPLPMLPESFEVVRLPPPHLRLSEVNYDIVPDADIVFSDADSSDSDDEEEQEEPDADGEDDDMEEVGIEAPALPDMDEDYDD